MKKNRMMRLASILLVCVLLSTSVISGTFAKYTSEATLAADTARVAKWEIQLNGESINEEFTFDLFETINDTGNTAAETDVATTEKIIAPGTAGSFDIELLNKSEVTAQYAIDYTVTNTNSIPVKFSVDNGTNWTTDLADVAASDSTKLAMGATEATKVTVLWKWDYSVDATQDAADTEFGEKATLDTITVTATITVEQVD